MNIKEMSLPIPKNGKPITNFEKITKNEGTLTTWLSEKLYFCSAVSCEECVAKQECYSHESNDTEDYTNADLWYAWLKQPHIEKE